MKSLETLFKSAKVNSFQSEKTIFLQANQEIHLVQKGGLEVYFCTRNEKGQRNRGEHFTTLKEGDLLCNPLIQDDIYFYITGNTQTQLLSISLETFLLQALHPDNNPNDAIEYFHAWIKRFHLFLSASLLSPKQFLPLEASDNVDQPSILKPIQKDTCWLELNKGEAHVYDQSSLCLSPEQRFFAITPLVWLSTKTPCSYTIYSTKTLFEKGDLFHAMKGFYLHVNKALSEYITQKMINETQKLQMRAKQDERQVTQAILSLASVIDEALAAPEFSETLNPYLAVCKIVGNALEIDIKEYSDLRKNQSASETVKKITRASGVKIRDVLLIGEWYKSDHGPLIGYLNHEGEKQVVALLPSKNMTYVMVNPTDGTRKQIDEKLASSLDNFAHMMYKPLPNRVLHIKDIYRLILFGAKKDLKMILGMGILVGLLGMLTPIFTGKIFDTIIPESNYFQLTQIGIALLSIALGSTLFNVAKGLAVARTQGQVSLHLQSAIWDRLLSLPAPFFRDYNTGDLAMRANGINQIQDMLTGTLMSTLLSGIFSFFSLVLLFYYSAKLALISLVLVFIAILFSFYSAYIQVQYQRQIVEKNGLMTGFVLQLLNGIQKIRAAGAEKRAFAQWAKRYAEQRGIAFKAGNSENYLEVFNDIFPMFTNIVIFSSVVFLMQTDAKFTTGAFIAFNAAFGQFLSASLSMSSVLIGILNIVPIYKRIEPIFLAVPEVDTIKADPGELSGAIEVSNLKFRYPKSENDTLKGINFSILPGKFIAFVGPSGSGKSTIFRLLLGFEKPTSGSIFYDKQHLLELDIQAVRRQIGTVLQNGQIIQGDIFNNIVGATGMTLEDAWNAAAMAGFDEDIRQMPMGMHTAVSSGGGTLSGGQRQRLLIARALITKPRIILFDEATSALDNRTQSIVTQSLEKLQSTRIVIAHRLSTIQNADYIYVIDEGAIVEHGTYEDLIQQEGLFKKLAQRQLS